MLTLERVEICERPPLVPVCVREAESIQFCTPAAPAAFHLPPLIEYRWERAVEAVESSLRFGFG